MVIDSSSRSAIPATANIAFYPPNCVQTNDREWQNGMAAPEPRNPPNRKRHYYLTARGTELMSAVELGIGRRITSFELDQAEAEENVRRLGKGDPRSEYCTVENEIVEYLFSV